MTARLPEPLAEIAVESADGAVLLVRRHGNVQAATRLFVSHGNGFAIDGYIDFWSRFLAISTSSRSTCAATATTLLPSRPTTTMRTCRRTSTRSAAPCAPNSARKPRPGCFIRCRRSRRCLQTIAGPVHFDALIAFDPPNVPAPGHPVRDAMVGYEHKLANWASDRPTRFADPAELAAEFAATRSGRRWAPGASIAMARAVLRRDSDGWGLACPREREASMYLQGIDLGLWPRRADLPIPVALIGADPEAPYPAATALSNRALAHEDGFDYRAIPGTSHLLQLEEPAACAEAALAALSRLGLA